MTSNHSHQSSFREKLIEHLFIGELLKLSWQRGDCALEIARPEVDNAGYDLIAENHDVVRHIQLKTSYLGSKTAKQTIHTRLATKPSGCIIWIFFDQHTLDLGPFLFFGAKAGQPLKGFDKLNTAKHTKGNHLGIKAERPNIRLVNKGQFSVYQSLDKLYQSLFYQP